ncbi:uncharacterized protein JCM15063_001489 [Sporobolomyces koalae]|uniref:uncharacterized protein n=1 Tax=Sporobolomyces koalae TaxID=500713 RepID=UPI00317EC689
MPRTKNKAKPKAKLSQADRSSPPAASTSKRSNPIASTSGPATAQPASNVPASTKSKMSTSSTGASKSKKRQVEELILSDSSEAHSEDKLDTKHAAPTAKKRTSAKSGATEKTKDTSKAKKKKTKSRFDSSDVELEPAQANSNEIVKAKKKHKKPTTTTAAASTRGDPSNMNTASTSSSKQSNKIIHSKFLQMMRQAAYSEPVPFEQALSEWFAQFVEQPLSDQDPHPEAGDTTGKALFDQGTMSAEGIEKLFEEMQLSIEDTHMFILAWKLQAEPGTFGSFKYTDFERTLRPFDIRGSIALSDYLGEVKMRLYTPPPTFMKDYDLNSDSEVDSQCSRSSAAREIVAPKKKNRLSNSSFDQFYKFVFGYIKTQGSKVIPKEMAIPIWTLLFQVPSMDSGDSQGEAEEDEDMFKGMGQEFVQFAESQGDGFKSVSQDVWNQLLEFLNTIEPDLSNWNELDACKSPLSLSSSDLTRQKRMNR